MSAGRERFEPPLPYESIPKQPFRRLPPESWSPELHRADALVAALVDLRCLEILAALGIEAGEVGRTAAELADSAGVQAERRPAFAWLLRRLADADLLAGDPAGTVERILPARWDAGTIEEAMRDAVGDLGPTFALIERAARAWPAVLKGEREGSEVLFSREALGYWEDYFDNRNLGYAAINWLAAAAADEAVPGGRLRVLEVGGGCGSAAQALVERLGDRIGEYLFTEISPVFLSRARRRLEDPRVSFARADLERPLAAQGVGGGYDLVYAVNVLHATRDLVASLAALRGCLAPGGALVLGEAVRPRRDATVSVELVFQLAPEFAPGPDPEFRPVGGFLWHVDWPRALERAGFGEARTLPDPEAALAAYPTYSMAALVARA